jgi:hypothetical protein
VMHTPNRVRRHASSPSSSRSVERRGARVDSTQSSRPSSWGRLCARGGERGGDSEDERFAATGRRFESTNAKANERESARAKTRARARWTYFRVTSSLFLTRTRRRTVAPVRRRVLGDRTATRRWFPIVR